MVTDTLHFPKIFFVFLFFLFSGLLSKNSFAEKSNATHALSEVQKKYRVHSTVSFDFEQTQKSKITGVSKRSSGKILIRRPGFFKWETLTPEVSLLISDGSQVWFYTAPFRKGEKGQVVVRKAADVQSKLAVDLLSGVANIQRDFRVHAKSVGKTNNNPDIAYELTPLKPAGDVTRIELFVDKKAAIVYKLRLSTASEKETILELKNVVLGARIDASVFKFEVPPDTEVIRN